MPDSRYNDPNFTFSNPMWLTSDSYWKARLIAQQIANLDIPFNRIIDYGCGSGILGIAGLLLGAEKAIGVDIDPQALQATKENLKRNQLADDILHVYLPENAPDAQADTVVANILAGPLVTLAPTLAALVKPAGHLCLSGLLADQADDIRATYSQWFTLDAVEEKKGWIRITGRKHDA